MADKQFRAIHRWAPMSARKARPVADLVRGMTVNQAMEALEYIPRRAGPLVLKVLKSAVANASQEGSLEAGQLVVSSARVNDGPLKQGRLRWRPGPMGRATPIRKRTCHIEITVAADESLAGSSRRRAKTTAPETEGAGTEEEN